MDKLLGGLFNFAMNEKFSDQVNRKAFFAILVVILSPETHKKVGEFIKAKKFLNILKDETEKKLNDFQNSIKQSEIQK